MAQPIETGGNGWKFSIKDFLLHPERKHTVVRVDNRPDRDDIKAFYNWSQDKETARHLVPNFKIIDEADEYYYQDKALFLIARNSYLEPIGVLTVKREPNLKGRRKVAYVEKMMVKPEFQAKKPGEGKDIGKTLFTTAVDSYIFAPETPVQGEEGRRENPRPRFEEFRLWIMTDDQAGDFRKNYNFFVNGMGLQIVRDRPLWSQYAREVYGEETNRQALWLYSNPELWDSAKESAAKRGKPLQSVPLLPLKSVSL